MSEPQQHPRIRSIRRREAPATPEPIHARDSIPLARLTAETVAAVKANISPQHAVKLVRHLHDFAAHCEAAGLTHLPDDRLAEVAKEFLAVTPTGGTPTAYTRDIRRAIRKLLKGALRAGVFVSDPFFTHYDRVAYGENLPVALKVRTHHPGGDKEMETLESPAWTVSADQVEEALRIVERTGLVEEFEDRLMARRGRRRRHCNFEGLLVALVVNVMILNRSPFLSEAAVTLYECMPEEYRRRFQANYSVRTTNDRAAVTKAVERLWAKFRLCVDSEPLPPGPRRTPEQMAEMTRSLPPELRAQLDEALLHVMNRIVGATVSTLLEQLPKPTGWLYGLDATFVESHALPGKKGNFSADPQAGWYIRRKENHGGANATASGGPSHRVSSGRTKEVRAWGYEVHIVGLAPDPYSPFRDVPELACGITIDRPGFSPTDNGIKAIDATLDMGLPAGILGFDAAYITDRLLSRAQEAGFGALFDPKAQQADRTIYHKGGLVAGGGMVCPGVEKTLLRMNADYHQQRIDKATLYARGEAMEAFRARTKEVKKDGKVVVACPALAPPGRAPTCCCPLRPKSYDYDGLPEVPNAPGVKGGSNETAKPGKLCTQGSVTVDPTELVNVWQAYPHRSPEWRSMYAAVRNAMERNHSQSKAGYGEALAVCDRRGLKGKANAGLMSALLLAAHNRRLIHSWLRNAQRDEAGDIIGPPVKNQRRDRMPWHSKPE